MDDALVIKPFVFEKFLIYGPTPVSKKSFREVGPPEAPIVVCNSCDFITAHRAQSVPHVPRRIIAWKGLARVLQAAV